MVPNTLLCCPLVLFHLFDCSHLLHYLLQMFKCPRGSILSPLFKWAKGSLCDCSHFYIVSDLCPTQSTGTLHALNSSLCTLHSASVSTTHQVTPAKTLKVVLDCLLSTFRSITMTFCEFHLLNIPRPCSSSSILIAPIVVESSSCLDFCHGLLNNVLVSNMVPLKFILHRG